MTRQKKEIWKKIEYIERMIDADMELGCGFAPADAYDEAYRQISELENQLVELNNSRKHGEEAS